MTSNAIELMRKYLGDKVNSEEFEIFFPDEQHTLYYSVSMTSKYPKLNDFLEEYLRINNIVNKYNFWGCHILLNAIRYYMSGCSTIRTLEILIKAGSDVNQQDDNFKNTALHFCLGRNDHENDPELIKFLILSGCDVFNLKDCKDKTAVDYFDEKLLEYLQINKETQTIGILSGKLTKPAKK